MSPPSPLPPQPPAPPPSHHHHLLCKTTSLPDVIFAAFSLFILLSSPKPTSVFFLPNNKICFPLNPRRFLKLPTMSSPLRYPTTPRSPGRRPFATPQSLSDWLKPRLPSDSFASWGVKPGTKNVHNLWLEISEGETSLADSTPPVRSVEVVIVRIIRNDGKVLVESHQELSNGDVRTRCRPLSEKMKTGESVEAAVFRAVEEELGSIIKNGNIQTFGHYGYDVNDIVKIVPNSYVKKVEERVSASYPGLPACYLLHTVDAEVEWLPEGEFCTEEVEEYGDFDGRNLADSAVHCKKHYWKWVDSNSV
ncbi:unnamed protein product [Fraxinus pennsylvanica]|uniref:Nudix hydrolase domain-containing protein n=1 Tax=Fraxinus pennsylvanica TaxID=56036 RepID=A0AAD1ZDH5_9LAMI|nr:unnamed protein product [Fraxinus pennsylvanica]